MNHHMGIERFENIARKQAMVDARVFVLVEFGEFVLTYVDHRKWSAPW